MLRSAPRRDAAAAALVLLVYGCVIYRLCWGIWVVGVRKWAEPAYSVPPTNTSQGLKDEFFDALQITNYGGIVATAGSIRDLYSCTKSIGSAFCWATNPVFAEAVATLVGVADTVQDVVKDKIADLQVRVLRCAAWHTPASWAPCYLANPRGKHSAGAGGSFPGAKHATGRCRPWQCAVV